MTDLELARKVLRTEAEAVLALEGRIDSRFSEAVRLLYGCRGRVVVTGMGKSGIIARKIAATLTSTGTSAFFLHPAEAVHGDLGAIQTDDVVVALSYSGETPELLRLLETIRRIGARLVAMTGGTTSPLARAADVVLDCGVDAEACPLNLVPTASTTATLAMGDALAMALLVEKGFRAEDFASLHPGGGIGKRLMKVSALMHAGSELPIVKADTPMRAAIAEMSAKRLGMTCVVSDDGRLLGIITDGDLRRHIGGPDLLDRHASAIMTPGPVTIDRDRLAVEALKLLEDRKITSLVVVDEHRRIEGVLHLHDLWRTQMF
ncbi:MAG: KpsF/GutQ family sugar-phosphate isomerase [Acidobacteriota bacterium]